tara:strand:+ start:2459 stop:3235 length:777 start_codon:yes stop_codon:yes gene_type:complete
MLFGVVPLKESAPAWQTIEALCALQEIDNQVHSVADERDNLRARLEQLNQLLERGREDLGNRLRKISDAEDWYRAQQDLLVTEKEKISRLKSQMGGVTKSKEYMAVQRELEMLRKASNERAEELDRFTEALESHKSAVGEEESKLKELESEANSENDMTQGRIEDFDKRINEIDGSRQDWLDKIPANVIRRYERVKSRREGTAIVEVIKERCAGCYMIIPPQLYNVLLRRDSLEICPSCNRYIYVPEGGEDAVEAEAG